MLSLLYIILKNFATPKKIPFYLEFCVITVNLFQKKRYVKSHRKISER